MTVITKARPKTSPGMERMKATLGPAKTEALRQSVVADQAKAKSEVGGKTKPAKKKAKTTKADARKITVLAKTNPHAGGSRRAGWFKQLKSGMTVEEAVKLGVRSVYLERMAARKILKIG